MVGTVVVGDVDAAVDVGGTVVGAVGLYVGSGFWQKVPEVPPTQVQVKSLMPSVQVPLLRQTRGKMQSFSLISQ